MQETLLIIILTVIFYLVGSIPTAYIILKLLHKKDITKEGSGNVGAMNSYDVSGSKKTGILVFIIDLLKGVVPALFVLYVLHLNFEASFIPLVALVAGHNFSIWLKFKGGRGLATSAAIFFVLNYWVVVIWCFIYLISFLIKKNVHIDNTVATILMPIVLLILNSQGLKYFQYSGTSNGVFIMFCSIICVLILMKHIAPILSITNKNC